jgi:[ribosomal protein S5]-alanine N-acetyltransferase
MIISYTPRLILREFQIDDAMVLYELNLDPDVMRYTGDKPFVSCEAAMFFISNYDHYKKHGFGRWVVQLRETDEVIGWCGLKRHEPTVITDLGFRFFKKYWNRGYASEAAIESLRLGFEKFNMQTIIGRAMKENTPSIRVLAKSGLSFLKEAVCGEEPGVVYQIDKETYLKSISTGAK